MADRYGAKAGVLALFLLIGISDAFVASQFLKSSFPRAISDLKDTVVKSLGKQAEGLELSGFDPRDAKVGQSISYEFHVEIDKKVFPIKLLEDVSRWNFVDFPIFGPGRDGEEEKGLAEVGKVPESKVLPVLPPFQLAGPMELWIQDGDDMRLALPHDVDAGVLKKVVLSDGAVVTVKGAKSVSLRHPVELPLPLNRTQERRGIASGLLALAEALRHAARSNEKPLLSLRIVGPTSLTSSSSSMASKDRLKLKRLAPGLIELSSSSVPALSEETEGACDPILWPLTSLNGSDSNLRGFEELLASILGEKGKNEGSFRLLKAEVSSRTYVKLGFAMEKQILDGDVDWSSFPSWKTKPEKVRSHFEVLARVEENGKIVPERIAEIPPIPSKETVLSVQTGNLTMSKLPIYIPPPDYFTL
ncbi:hypothetical protein Taro_009595 [Colocasia esculenta]|uniref:Tunicamycin induced 1 n=1 Tax=Colocasia esculenta TaxID=4460 RepID=A0A843U653_COLES|nr:hypothetical protein [Colocasia esculenta]